MQEGRQAPVRAVQQHELQQAAGTVAVELLQQALAMRPLCLERALPSPVLNLQQVTAGVISGVKNQHIHPARLLPAHHVLKQLLYAEVEVEQ